MDVWERASARDAQLSWLRGGGVVCLVSLLCILFAVSTAQAAAPKFLLQMGDSGSGADQTIAPRGIAVEPNTSHVYVADLANWRVDEYTPWGEFVKAFGWDVAPGAVDEEQEVRIRATAGQFKLTYEASTTPDLPFDATAEEVEAVLDALSSISTGGGGVTVEGGPGGIPGTTPSVYVVRFDGGPLKGTDLTQLTVSNGTAPLSGGNPTTLETRTRADGTAGGTGLESCTAASGCQAGATGGGAGQVRPGGMAFDAAGNLYTFELGNLRIQKFDAAGRFIWMVGGEVNKTTGEDFCDKADLEAAEVCGAGVSGTGPREFQIFPELGTTGDYLEMGVNDNLYVGDTNRIQEITTTGAFVGEIKFSDVNAETPAFPATGEPGGLAVDPNDGSLYLTFRQPLFSAKVNDVFKLSPSGDLLDILDVEAPEALATDSEGNVYVAEVPETQVSRVVGFEADGNPLFTYAEGIEGGLGVRILGLATNAIRDLFVSKANPGAGINHVSAYGPPPVGLEPPPRVAPEIEAQFAITVDTDSAEVGALINPHLWSDTRYYVEYGTESCASSTCTKVPIPPGELLTGDVVDASIETGNIVLSGLEEETTYHFRFVAESSGGGPTIGGPTPGEEVTFRTRRPPDATKACPGNELVPRSTFSQELPDCRAYEMVSPINKNGGDLVPLCQIYCFPAALDQSAATAAKLTYSTYNSFGDAESAPYTSQYLASRVAGKAWESDGISLPLNGVSGLDRAYEAFTRELEFGWIPRASNIFRRDNSDASLKPMLPEPMGGGPELEAFTSDTRCIAFRAQTKLTDNAIPGLSQTYKSCDGVVTLVSVLPGGAASTNPSSAGSPQEPANGREGSMFNALSEDGERVFWTEDTPGPEDPLYVRIGDTATKQISTGTGFFWGASSDGTRVIYQEGGDLKEATIDGAGNVATATIATQTIGVAGTSEDATHVYFASRADLDGGGGATAGHPNLYLLERTASAPAGGGTISFIVALSELDVLAGKVSPVAQRPTYRQSRVNPDGGHLAFMSRGQLTGYDNTDQVNGKPDAEVFLYDAAEDELVCASCNPTGARPVGQETMFGLKGSLTTGVQAAGKLPNVNYSQLYASRALSEDGSRLFFESYDRLDPDDTSAAGDIYQWEELGAGPAEDECEETDASFDPKSGGCIDLISSGTSPLDAEFLDASASGNDVFFSTISSLIAADPSQIDIYDARVGGGLPEPPTPETKAPQCLGPDCRPSVPSPPTPSAPQSENLGPGNDPLKTTKRCRKGTHKVKKKGKVRCVKNKKAKSGKGKANKSGRAGR